MSETAPDAVSYGALVRGRFARDRSALAAVCCLAGLLLIATAAPLLSFHQPLLFWQDDAIAFPFFASLFNRLIFENAVDLFFNLLLLATPLYAAIAWIGTRRGRTGRWLLGLGVLHLLVTAALAPAEIGSMRNPLFHQAPIVDYRAMESRLAAEGEAVVAVFPLRRFHFRETDPTRSLQAPSAAHWLGTDAEGRDVFAHMLYGTRVSLTIGVIAVSIYVTIGVLFGAIWRATFGGWVDVRRSRAWWRW